MHRQLWDLFPQVFHYMLQFQRENLSLPPNISWQLETTAHTMHAADKARELASNVPTEVRQ